MKIERKPIQNPKLTDLEKADCLTGKAMGGIVLRTPGRGEGKRRRFVFEDRVSCYHVMSRTAGGDMLFGDVEKEAFCKLMRRMERFSGIEVMTFAVMGNHFHLLLRVPCREKFLAKFSSGTREEREVRLFQHLKLLYSRAYLTQLEVELAVMKEKKITDLYEKTITSYLDRLCSLKHFMKELKERFSRWFNKRHGRQGTLWQDRYKSILVQDGEAAVTMAAYIDLNPLRAGLVEDPGDYRWSGYAEAVAGSQRARTGICRTLGISREVWGKKGAMIYRQILLREGMERHEVKPQKNGNGRPKKVYVKTKRGFDKASALAQLKTGGKLTRGQLLRCRVRSFTEGKVIGSRDFVEKAFDLKREWFGENRKREAQGLPLRSENQGADYELYAVRAFRLE